MECLNFDEYVRKNPRHTQIEFKIMRRMDMGSLYFVIKYLSYEKRLLRKPKEVWVTLCYAGNHSQGVDWLPKSFIEKDHAEMFINSLVKKQHSSEEEVFHIMKTIRRD